MKVIRPATIMVFCGCLLATALSACGGGSARISLVSIAVAPNAPSTPKGLTQQFKATGTYSDTSTADLTTKVNWASGTPANATIDRTSGLATALATGVAAITATSGSISGSTTLTVTPAVVESIAITPNPAVVGISAGMSTQLTATGTFSDGTTARVTSIANWTSSTPTVATIDPKSGVAIGVSLGFSTISAVIGSVTGTVPLSAITDAWISTGGMNMPRAAHTATLLANGTVLVAGGFTDTGLLSSAEIYDPTDGTWTLTGSLATARESHTATLLTDGKVLAAGGVDSAGDSLASAELYDPLAGTWASTGNLTTARVGHTATLLQNGTVLVTGGGTAAEIYDPDLGIWTPTGSPIAGILLEHTATLLQNGTVLVTGGATGTGGSASAELYDPADGTWTSTGDLTSPRFDHTATLLQSGMVLVAGGAGGNPQGSFYEVVQASAELYNAATGSWTPTGSLTTAFANRTATLLTNGSVLVVGGGRTTPGGVLLSADANIYDPLTGTWALAASLPTGRWLHTATLLPNGTVLIAGGELNGNVPSASSLIYY